MRIFYVIFSMVLFTAGAAAQLSTSAYRVLGQPDLRQNGINRVLGVEMNSPGAVVLDGRDGPLHLYVADTLNHRVLGWRDAKSYQIGDAPTIVLGQPGRQYSAPLGIGTKGFNGPLGMAVDPLTGNLYVADYGNNRILRFPNPFANPTRVEPDAVYGQANFSNRTANPAGISRNSLKGPRSLAFDAGGNLWVSDSGNHRVLRFNVSALDNTNPDADLVIGQKDFASGAANRGTGTPSASGFDTPSGLAFDTSGNLYVSDFNNTRVLKFAAPIVLDAAAGTVFGQSGFTTRGVTAQASNSTLSGPVGLTVDSSGNLYVAVPGDNRVMIFASNAASGAAAKDVLGQTDFNSTSANPFSFPVASSRSFAGVSDVKTDADGNLYVADTVNNRVISFPRGSKTATVVWGQNDFSSNGINQIKPGSINGAFKIVVDYSQSPYALYVSDTNNHRILGWRDAARFHTGDAADIVIGQPSFATAVPNVDTRGSLKPSPTSLAFPRGLAMDAFGNLYVADTGNNRVLRYPRPISQSGRIAPDLVIGQVDFNTSTSAAVSAASLKAPSAVAIGPDGDVFVADTGNNRVLEFPSNASAGVGAIRVYGQPNFTAADVLSPASAQTLVSPQGIFVDAGSTLYIADTGNNRALVLANTKDAPVSGAAAVMVIGQDGFDGTGSGSGANHLRTPTDIALDSSGEVVIADAGNNRVMVFPSLLFLPLSGASATMALGQSDLNGTNINWNSSDGLATPEGLAGAVGIYVDRRDTVYVADSGNNRVVHFLKPIVITHAANKQSGISVARGGMAQITGSGLADAQETAAGTPLPVALADRQVVINDDTQAPLSSVAADGISLQIPSAAPLGTQRFAVRLADTAELVAGTTAAVAALSPGLFAAGDPKFAVLNQDGTPNSTSNPATKGSTIKIFGTGQGPVSPQVNDGDAAPSAPPASTIAVPTSDGNACITNQPSVCVAIQTTFADIQFSGLAPGMVGIWQLTVKIPATAPSGNAVPLAARINAAPSNIINIAIK